jgi:alkylated DNA repair dioxygenase AlkB
MYRRYAITFGECAIPHVGREKLGSRREDGYTLEELTKISNYLSTQGYATEHINLTDLLPLSLRAGNDASVLVIRNNRDKPLFGNPDQYYQEQEKIEYDKKYFDKGKTMNKLARYNMVFGDTEIAHSEDYTQATIKSFASLPCLNFLRTYLSYPFGPKASNLYAEGNCYFNAKSHIGFHGDTERKVVICLSLGASCNLKYHWRMASSSDNGPGREIALNHGDIYVMSEKATGYDWRMRSKVRLVHGVESINL